MAANMDNDSKKLSNVLILAVAAFCFFIGNVNTALRDSCQVLLTGNAEYDYVIQSERHTDINRLFSNESAGTYINLSDLPQTPLSAIAESSKICHFLSFVIRKKSQTNLHLSASLKKKFSRVLLI